MKRSVFTFVVGGLMLAQAAQAQDAQALLHKYSCYICHTNDQGGAGPAFVDVAAKYKGNPKAARILRAVVKNGQHGGGPWHMPPAPEVSDAAAKEMVRYILSLKP